MDTRIRGYDRVCGYDKVCGYDRVCGYDDDMVMTECGLYVSRGGYGN